MTLKTTSTIVGVLMFGGFAAATVEMNDARTVAEQYWKLAFVERDLDAAAALMVEDVRFRDPTAAIIDESLSEEIVESLAKGITGRDAVLELQQSWRVERVRVEKDISFTCGEFACFAGTLSYWTAHDPPVRDLPFTTILRIRDEKIVSRTDYGDYTKSFPEPPAAPEPELESVAKKYLSAYVDMRFVDLAKLLADEAVFHDPTSAFLGKGAPYEGRENIINMFQGAFDVVLEFEFEPVRSFFFQHHAVFVGHCRYAMSGAAIGLERERIDTEPIPMIVILRIEDGKIVEHLDYADYEAFQKQIGALQTSD